MRYVSIALSVEGPTDKAFLWPIVYRTALSLAENAVIQEQPFFIERSRNEDRIVEICEHAGEFDIFVVHADATRTAIARTEEKIVDAIRTGVVARGRIDGRRLVGLVTVSEMESWAIASPDAIAQSLGFDGWPNRLPLAWNSIDVETLDDPKRELKSALQKLLQRNLDPALFYDTLEALGSRVPLDALAVLPSYCKFRERLRECLKALRAAR